MGRDSDRQLTAEQPVPASTLVRLAWCYLPVAAAIYAIDLLRQTADRLTDGAGRPFGDDFVNYWSAAFLAWHHRAVDIYNAPAFHAFQQSIVGPHVGGFHYSYPPTALLLTAPLGFMPYVPGLVFWLIAGWLAFYAALRAVMPNGRALLFALATPAVFVNTVNGQNGTWTAALFGGGLILLERRPTLAGVLFGLLVYKPHLGLLIPVALLAGRRWRAAAAAAATVIIVVALSVLCFGERVYADYFHQADVLRQAVLESGEGVWHRMMSTFVAARRLGADVTAAYVVQAGSALFAATVVALLWLRDAPPAIRNAALLLGTCMAVPYLQDYDLVLGALVVVWLADAAPSDAQSQRNVFIAAALLLIGPFINAALGRWTGFAFGPLFILPAFGIVAAQALQRPQPASTVT
jgi:hypothetical protein